MTKEATPTILEDASLKRLNGVLNQARLRGVSGMSLRGSLYGFCMTYGCRATFADVYRSKIKESSYTVWPPVYVLFAGSYVGARPCNFFFFKEF